jgi:hypothetical protein
VEESERKFLYGTWIVLEGDDEVYLEWVSESNIHGLSREDYIDNHIYEVYLSMNEFIEDRPVIWDILRKNGLLDEDTVRSIVEEYSLVADEMMMGKIRTLSSR